MLEERAENKDIFSESAARVDSLRECLSPFINLLFTCNNQSPCSEKGRYISVCINREMPVIDYGKGAIFAGGNKVDGGTLPKNHLFANKAFSSCPEKVYTLCGDPFPAQVFKIFLLGRVVFFVSSFVVRREPLTVQAGVHKEHKRKAHQGHDDCL